jgi:hypothetical protein
MNMSTKGHSTFIDSYRSTNVEIMYEPTDMLILYQLLRDGNVYFYLFLSQKYPTSCQA